MRHTCPNSEPAAPVSGGRGEPSALDARGRKEPLDPALPTLFMRLGARRA